MRQIDHIVMSFLNLEKACTKFESLTGITPTIGGQHLTKGTHNALVNIGDQIYLELIAPDPKNEQIKSPTWMAVSKIEQPRITRWAIKSSDINKDALVLNNFNKQYGKIESGSRQKTDGSMLRWQLSDPGNDIPIDIAPFLLDWQDSIHPTQDLKETCSLESIMIIHESPQIYQPLFRSLGIDFQIKKGDYPAIKIALKTPKGIIHLE